ncbi:hypothetical protein NP493_7802g00002, partial [Ridgeia piscesae]
NTANQEESARWDTGSATADNAADPQRGERQISTILGNRQCDTEATTTATMNDSVFNIRAAGAGTCRHAIIDMEHDDDVYN